MQDKRLNMGTWTAIGAGIGAALGVAMNNIGVGLAIGIAIGVGIGAAMSRLDINRPAAGPGRVKD